MKLRLGKPLQKPMRQMDHFRQLLTMAVQSVMPTTPTGKLKTLQLREL
jgi:hypothetical protein